MKAALFCVISTLLLATGSGQLLLPTITTHPESGIYQEYTATQPTVVTLNCAISPESATLSWLYDGEEISASDPDRTIGPSTLTISRFTAALAGEYSCRASNDLGTITSAIALIQASFLQATPHGSTASSPHPITTQAGHPVILDCGPVEALPDYSIEWEIYDPSGGIEIRDTDHAVVGLNGSLYLQDPTMAQSGTIFECTIENSPLLIVFRGYIQVTVTVSQAPTIPQLISGPADANVNEGDALFLECIVGGSPVPEILWETPNVATAFIAEESGTQLRVISLQREDAGTFICHAGDIMYSAVVTIRDPPTVTVELPSTQDVVYGGQITLQCEAQGLDQVWQWYHNGTRVANAESSSLALPVSASGGGVGENDSGAYQCFAINPAGVSYSAGFINVTTEAPMFTSGGLPASDLAYTDLPFEYTCTATGAPPPVYQWQKDSIPLADGTAFNLSRPGVLKINRVESTHQGVYTCRVENRIGQRLIGHVTSTSDLLVIERTVFISTLLEEFTTQIGTQATLTCEASFDSVASVRFSWTKDGSPLQLNDRVMFASDPTQSGSVLITSVVEEDAGMYQCSVETTFQGLQGPLVQSLVTDVMVSTTPIGPTILTVTAVNSTSIEVRWYFSSSPSLLTGYEIELRPSGQASLPWRQVHDQTTASQTATIIANLQPFTSYDVRAIALYAESGDRVPSLVITVMTATDVPSDAPSMLSLVASNNTDLVLAWTAPTQPNGLITSYQLRTAPLGLSDTEAEVVLTGSDSTTFTLTELTPRTTYTVSVAALTSAGLGPFSEAIEAVTIPSGSLVEPTATAVYERAWFIAVIVVVGLVALAVVVAVLALLIKFVCSKKQTRKYHIRPASGYFGGGKHTVDSPSLDDDAVQAYMDRNRRTEINAFGSDALDSIMDRESSLGDSQYTPQLSTSSASRLMAGQMAPSYINPPTFEEAVASKQRASPYSEHLADSELGMELQQVGQMTSSPHHPQEDTAMRWDDHDDKGSSMEDEIDVPQHDVFIPNASTLFDYEDESDSVEKPYYSSSRSSDVDYSVKESLPVIPGHPLSEVENFATFV